ncbi:7-deoxyloganetic acid glucosyltransferase [Salvia divinorum]|uniref:7-deoxyloganetic acid glucosyltransferase n=1 Tax=Salvia divinorum TaxID=28513 RepID=A0ABD1GWD2_SALDI
MSYEAKQFGSMQAESANLRSPLIADENRHECLRWLDKQKSRSVIYVSSRNTVTISDEEAKELAHGLMQSEVKFLWVLGDVDKCNVFDGDVRRVDLPKGGFMSHCGWNSCIKSITAGVAIAAWPMHYDQPTNVTLVADILKTGIMLMEWKDGSEVVKTPQIENVVRRLMASEEGKRLGRRRRSWGPP